MSGHLVSNLIHVIPQLGKIGIHRGELICAHHERNALINFFFVLWYTITAAAPRWIPIFPAFSLRFCISKVPFTCARELACPTSEHLPVRFCVDADATSMPVVWVHWLMSRGQIPTDSLVPIATP